MKKNLLLAVVLLAACTESGERIIERPAFRAGTSRYIMPSRVELTKEATVVHFHIRYADWGNWSLGETRLEADGKTYACQRGRILTREGDKVLSDEAFEFEKEYEKDARRDSVILYFDPLPRKTRTFDFIEGDDLSRWNLLGIRLDNRLYPELLPAPKPRKDDGKPLEPLSLKYGQATATFTAHGDSIGNFGWAGDNSCDPVTGDYWVESQREGSTCSYSQPAYAAVMPLIIGPKIYPDGFGNQYNLLLIPGETLTFDFDPTTCNAWLNDFAAGKPQHKGYRTGGTLGDLNEVLLDYRNYTLISLSPVAPSHSEVKDFPEWRDRLWQGIDSVRRAMMQRTDYTRRQKDFGQLLLDRAYMRSCVNYMGLLASKGRINPDSVLAVLAHLKQTFTLVDPHASDLQFGRDGRSFYFPLGEDLLPYYEANGMTEGDPYKMTRAQADAKKISETMQQGQVLPEDSIEKAHPYFQRILREFNDSIRIQQERLQREATGRVMPTPDVPGNKFLEHIVGEHPGKAVFFDLWATWCGPCMRGIAAMEPLKKELQGKDVVFVYLTNESSAIKDWSKNVMEIPGLHYRIPSAKWDQLPLKGGIPQYYLYDRQGKLVWEQTGFGDEVLEDIKRQIASALGE